MAAIERTRTSFLSILTMARNECQSYAEWLAHHRNQGVNHFYIIDNNSTDGCLERLAAQHDVTIWTWAGRARAVVDTDGATLLARLKAASGLAAVVEVRHF